MKRTKNTELENLISELKKFSIEQDVKLWKRIAVELEKPTRSKRIVNLSKIDKFTKEGDLIVVPGKVLSSGDLTHNVTVSAHAFSDKAKNKISEKGKALSIRELMKTNPKAKGIRIIG
jgi:large subunit ribosomal protein L18e